MNCLKFFVTQVGDDTWEIHCPAMKHESYVKRCDIGKRCQELIDEYLEMKEAGI